MNADEKKCPRCAETIKAEAYVCRFCNLNLSAWPKTAARDHRSVESSPNWPKAIIVAVVVVVLGLAMFGGGREEEETSAPPVVNEATPASVEAAPQARQVAVGELFAAYGANEARAQQEYGGQPVIITGRVRSVELDLTNDPVVSLGDGGLELNAHFDKRSGGAATSNLVKGQEATVWCERVSEVLGDPVLYDCQVMDK